MLLAVACLLSSSNVLGKNRNKHFRYPEVVALRASLLRVIAETADTFRQINKDPGSASKNAGEREIPHIIEGDKPDFYAVSKNSPLSYWDDLQFFPERHEDSKIALFRWQQLIAAALPEHLPTVPEWDSRLNESARYYYYPGTRENNGIILSICQNGGDIRLYVSIATSRELEIVHAYNDGVPYNGWHVVMIESAMYDSSFHGNHYTGEVLYKYHNGGRYRGYFVDGLPEGEGDLILPEEKVKYTGTFLNGKYHGKGKLTKGNVGYAGEFRNGELLPGTYTPSDETEHYTITSPGMDRYRNYASSASATSSTGVCENCKGKGVVSVQAPCFSCHGTGSSGSGYKTYDAHGYETGYKSLGCSYCHSTGFYTKYKRCSSCNGKGR